MAPRGSVRVSVRTTTPAGDHDTGGHLQPMKGQTMATRQEQLEALREIGIDPDDFHDAAAANLAASKRPLKRISDLDPAVVYAHFNGGKAKRKPAADGGDE